MDRPIGATHPKHHDMIYPINYGYVPGLIGGDGEEQDVYVFIKDHENLRYKRLCKEKCFRSLFERLYYKNYITGVWKAKINKLKRTNEASKEMCNDVEIKELS